MTSARLRPNPSGPEVRYRDREARQTATGAAADHLLGLQRAVGNRATTAHMSAPVVQRDAVDDWHATATADRKRDTKLATVDLRVTQILNETDDGRRIWRLKLLLSALDELSESGYKKQSKALQELRVRAETRMRAANIRIDSDANQRGNLAAHMRFGSVPGAAGTFATRTMDNAKLAGWTAPAGTLKDFLSQPRDAHGHLTATTLAAWTAQGQADIQGAITRFRTGGVGTSGITADQARQYLAAGQQDPVTGRENPEATQYAGAAPDLTNAAAQEVTVTQNLAGTAVNITYNTTDPTWNARIVALERALAKLSAVLATPVPGFNVYLPKFAKTLSRAGNAIQVHDAGHRAEFMFPDTLFLSPSAMVPSVQTSISYEETKKAVDKGTLAAMEGVPTCVHEVAHFVHFHQNPTQFLELSMSSIAGHTKHGKQRAAHIADKVSQYGANNPRELVAEVVTGRAFGRSYDKETMEMYRALDGPALQ